MIPALPPTLTYGEVMAGFGALRDAERLDGSGVVRVDACGAQLVAWLAARGVAVEAPSPALRQALALLGLESGGQGDEP